MKLNSNIGMVNALIRIAIGLTLLSWSTAKLVKKPWCDSYLFVSLMGAMKVAEGIVRYCPLTDLFEMGQERLQQNQTSNENDSNVLEPMVPYNPT